MASHLRGQYRETPGTYLGRCKGPSVDVEELTVCACPTVTMNRLRDQTFDFDSRVDAEDYPSRQMTEHDAYTGMHTLGKKVGKSLTDVV